MQVGLIVLLGRCSPSHLANGMEHYFYILGTGDAVVLLVWRRTSDLQVAGSSHA